ncbi:hypothetical protein [Acidovorax sp. SUPP2825]|uniref:hypothetical protein n=1 Tax=Acidovorax sp. SUPP2825 TaxID=2920879 RepID=UPI0023DE2CFC|nr:hypothetical protein [Acidovorax sp. SUPP2825]GKS97664.1 hypothetical protein AVAK2825_24035 [Acidovorax sp. SUPP2825]
MESSFEKGYDKIIYPDGSIELNFKTQRISAHSGSNFAGILMMALYPVSCAVTSPAMMPFYDSRSVRNEFPLGLVIFWNILAVALWLFSIWKFNNKKSSLTIKPSVGIIFDSNQLPFAEIQTITTLTETSSRNGKGTAYVCANANGRQVKITKYMSPELAETIATEIKNASGYSWS